MNKFPSWDRSLVMSLKMVRRPRELRWADVLDDL